VNSEAARTYPLFEQFFHLCREAMFITRRDGKFVKVNSAFEKLLGYGREELSRINVLKTFESEADRAPYQKTIEAEGSVHQYPLVLKRRDGTPIPCFIDAITLRGGEGERVLGYHGIIRTRSDLVESFRAYFNQLKQERRQIREEGRS
jgi:PAS domain S-box-containing protein